jgi:hypothetical protein
VQVLTFYMCRLLGFRCEKPGQGSIAGPLARGYDDVEHRQYYTRPNAANNPPSEHLQAMLCIFRRVVVVCTERMEDILLQCSPSRQSLTAAFLSLPTLQQKREVYDCKWCTDSVIYEYKLVRLSMGGIKALVWTTLVRSPGQIISHQIVHDRES